MPLTQVIMPNDHVMCFMVWNELYSCLTHDYHDNHQTNTVSNCVQNNASYHSYNDSTDGSQPSAHNMQYSNPFTMDTIQERLQYLLCQPEAEEHLSSVNQLLTNQETADNHTPTETDNTTDNQHQVMSFTCTIVYCCHFGCHGSGKWWLRKMLQEQNGYQIMLLLTVIPVMLSSTSYTTANIIAGMDCTHDNVTFKFCPSTQELWQRLL